MASPRAAPADCAEAASRKRHKRKSKCEMKLHTVSPYGYAYRRYRLPGTATGYRVRYNL